MEEAVVQPEILSFDIQPCTIWQIHRGGQTMRWAVALLVWASSAIAGTACAQQFPRVADHYPSQLLIESLGKGLGVAPDIAARPLTGLTLELIKDFEKWMPMAYNDAVGYCTIGYGHLIATKSCESIALGKFARGLTVNEGLALLDEDSKLARIAVQRLVAAELNDDQFGALSSLVFNIGQTFFEGSTLRSLLNARLFDAAAREFPRWVRGPGGVLQGLVVRRTCEQLLFRGQLVVSAGGHFNRNSCKASGIAPEGGSLIDIYRGEKQ